MHSDNRLDHCNIVAIQMKYSEECMASRLSSFSPSLRYMAKYAYLNCIEIRRALSYADIGARGWIDSAVRTVPYKAVHEKAFASDKRSLMVLNLRTYVIVIPQSFLLGENSSFG